MGVTLSRDEWAFRCNLITSDGEAIIDFTAGHIHAAPAGVNGGVVFPLVLAVAPDQRGGTYTLQTVMTESQRADFVAGDFYVNIHSAFARGGEVRGQFDTFSVD